MGSVESLAKWLQEKPDEGGSTIVLQLRLDRDNTDTLQYLADRFSMAKATLAAELLKAALKDTLAATPTNDTQFYPDEYGEEVATPVHNYVKARQLRRREERIGNLDALDEELAVTSGDTDHEEA